MCERAGDTAVERERIIAHERLVLHFQALAKCQLTMSAGVIGNGGVTAVGASANAADGSATTVEGGGQPALLQAELRCLRSQNAGLQSRLRAMQERVDTLEAQQSRGNWSTERLAEYKRLQMMIRPEEVCKTACEVCQKTFGSLARHQMRARHGRIWRERQEETGSAKKRRLTQERGDRKQRKRDLLHEIRRPATLAMHESVNECGLEWLEARLPKHLKSKLKHPLCNVTNNKRNK
jgi:hypothetical protein